MGGLAANETADGHDSVVTAGLREERDRTGQLEGSGDLEDIDLRAARRRALESTALEGEGDVLVPARAHDRDTRLRPGVRSRRACLFSHHRGDFSPARDRLARLAFTHAYGLGRSGEDRSRGADARDRERSRRGPYR